MRLRSSVVLLGLLSVSPCFGLAAWGDQPIPAQTLSPQEQLRQTRAQVDEMAARLNKNGGSAQDWALLARSYLMFEDFDKAKDAARRLIALEPKQVEPRMVLAEVQMASAPHGQKLPDDFVVTMRDILSIDPHNLNGLYYVGMAELQAGHADQARVLWSDLLGRLPAGDPARADLTKRLDALGKK